jgi:glycosyltransferase involved in cell wall biosynthesis
VGPAEDKAPRVTVLAGAFPPAYLSGGPARSVEGLVEALGDEIAFSVITSAFDLGEPMPGVVTDRWVEVGRARVWYSSKRRLPARELHQLVRETQPDLVYLNSLFDLRFSILPLARLRRSRSRVPILLAPRGELSAGALAIRPWKKRAFLTLFRSLRLHRHIRWHASTALEAKDVTRAVGPVTCHIATNLRAGLRLGGAPNRPPRTRGSVSAVFLSRIAPKKNLSGLLDAIAVADADVSLAIAGPIDDAGYWAECTERMRRLPPGKTAVPVGAVGAADVVGFLAGFEVLALPTFGENFGHVVLESLAAGTPVIVGRDTPWGEVTSAGAGWVVDPNDRDQIARCLDEVAALTDEGLSAMASAAQALARRVHDDADGVDANRRMLVSCVGGPGDRWHRK